MKVFLPVLFSFIAAVGNAMFVLSQKRTDSRNPLILVAVSAIICGVLTLIAVPYWGKCSLREVIRENWIWMAVGGLSLFVTYIAMNLLYTRFGAGGYTLYAVMAIITTSIFVGIVLLKEPLNLYHGLAIVSTIFTILFYSMGQMKM